MRWMSENHHPFNIVKDCGFLLLMKMGWPGIYIPLLATVSHNVKKVFVNACQRISTMLKEHDGALHFATDAWTSPNHKAFIAVTVHLENKGIPLSMILDIVELAKLHSGVNLAAAFTNILDDFQISDKVSIQ